MIDDDFSSEVLVKFLKTLKVPVTGRSVQTELNRHPEGNTLLGYSDILDNFHVPNAAYKLRFHELKNLPLPFIAHLNKYGFVMIEKIVDNNFFLFNNLNTKRVLDEDEVKQQFTGSILIAEKINESGEINYRIKSRAEKIEKLRQPFVFATATILLLTYFSVNTAVISTLTSHLALLVLIKSFGLFISILLLSQSVNVNNNFIQKICNRSSKYNCNSILSSTAAKLTPYISWSEIGFFYFASTWLILLFNSNDLVLLHLLAIGSVLTLPYTVFSIYYQWRIAKQWCVFCCAIQATLWLEFFSVLQILTKPIFLPNLKQLVDLLIGIGAPIILWITIKPLLMKVMENRPLKTSAEKT